MKRTRRRPELQVEELEPRILFSADGAALLSADPADPAPLVRSLDAYGSPAPAGDIAADPVIPTSVQDHSRRRELAIVDRGVAGHEQLVAALQSDPSRSLEVVELDPATDGIAQISRALRGREGISAVHIISHGANGEVQLGATTLGFDGLIDNAAAIRRWGDALSDDADLLLYGCDISADADGRLLIEALSRLTGADVAASNDLTGSAALGGDWRLEAATGAIETAELFGDGEPAGWTGVLDLNPQAAEWQVGRLPGVTGNPGVDGKAAVATNASEDSLVVWVDSSTSSIMGRLYGASGPQGSAFQINQTTAGGPNSPAVTLDPGGGFRVAWSASDGSGQGVYLRLYDAWGNALTSEVRPYSSVSGDQTDPALSSLGSSGVITWTSSNGGLGVIKGRRFDIAGNFIGSEFTLPAPLQVSYEQSHSSVSVNASGDFVVAWEESNGELRAQRYSAAGALVGSTLSMATASGEAPSVTYFDDGEFVVAWQGQDGSGSGVFVRAFDNSGNGGSEVRANIGTAGAQQRPAVVRTSASTFAVAWQSDASGAEDVVVREFSKTAGISAVTGEIALATSTNGARTDPALAPVSAGGSLQAVWTGDQNGTADVYLRTLSRATPVLVDTTSDAADGNTSSIAALLASRGADGRISLREAILAANATTNSSGADVIEFAIPLSDPGYNAGTNTFTLNVSNLPTITDRVILDATTQATFLGVSPGLLGTGGTVGVDGLTLSKVIRPMIELDFGTAGGGTAGISVSASASVIRGFALVGNVGYGIALSSIAEYTLIEGNVIGSGAAAFTDPGTAKRMDRNIYTSNTDSVVIRNNLLGYSRHFGIDLGSDGVSGSDRALVENNEIRGASLGNVTLDPIYLNGVDDIVRGNLVIDSPGSGIDLQWGTTNALLQNNTIDNVGTGSGSEGHAVWLAGSGTATIDRNIIRNGPAAAIKVSPGANGVITRNALYGNSGLGIDLISDANEATGAVTANDAGDGDSGGNGLQNFPVLMGVTRIGTQAIFDGALNSTANTTFRLEFFASPSADASGYGEGQTYLASTTVTTAGDGNAVFSFSASGLPVSGGQFITATATRMSGATAVATSEFSLAIVATTLNQPPQLNAAASPTLGSVLEGATNPSGVTVASLVVDGSITDADGAAVEAIAVTALDTSLGTWQ
ncbi:MAG: DUF4347 domain-containing protein, partial [Betaproteobacteria bacterium]